MRKNVLSLSIAAMIGGFAGVAQADVFTPPPHRVKAVRVRFRGAAARDEVHDFTLADHWGAQPAPAASPVNPSAAAPRS